MDDYEINTAISDLRYDLERRIEDLEREVNHLKRDINAEISTALDIHTRYMHTGE